MSTVLQVIIGLVGALIVPEVYAAIPRLAVWVIKREAAKLPIHLQADHEEEWLQGNADRRGSIFQLVDALSLVVCGTARKIGRETAIHEFQILEARLNKVRTIQDLNSTKLSESRNSLSARLQRDKVAEGVNDLDRAFDQWIADATRKGSADTVLALGRLQVTSRKFFENLNSAMSVWRSNLITDLNEIAEKVEQYIYRLQAIDELRSNISTLLARSNGYPREIECLMQEAEYLLEPLLEPLCNSIDEKTNSEVWVKRHAQSERLRETITTAIGNVTRAANAL